MSQEPYRIVGRMEGLFPHQFAKYEMHRKRIGGDLGHCEPTRGHMNRILTPNARQASAMLTPFVATAFSANSRR